MSLANSYKSFTGLGSSYLNVRVLSNGKVEWRPFQVMLSSRTHALSHALIHMGLQTLMHTPADTSLCTYAHENTDTYVHTFAHAKTEIYEHSYAHANTDTRVHTYAHANTDTYVHTNAHKTQTHMRTLTNNKT